MVPTLIKSSSVLCYGVEIRFLKLDRTKASFSAISNFCMAKSLNLASNTYSGVSSEAAGKTEIAGEGSAIS